MEREFSFHMPPDKETNQKQSAVEEFVREFNMRESMRLKTQTMKHSEIEEPKIRKQPELHPNPKRVSADSSPPSSRVKSRNQIHNTQETSSDCLICPNLMDCPQRQKRIANPETPCPLSKEINGNSSESNIQES